MANEKTRPLSKEEAPDPSNVYERSHPENESGMGRLDNNKAVPTARPDSMEGAATNKQDGTRQLNAEDVIDQRSTARPS
jgi:hypothetical protein